MPVTDGSQTLLTAFALNEAGPSIQWHGGRGQCDAWGTWGSATFKLQYSPDNGTTWADLDATNAILTANGGFEFDCVPALIRGIASGGTAASLNSKVNRI